ncbi:ABC transporter permease [Virgibacillus sp. W0181]|uniref:ABC transporter permease n=1 Tax=Virgibacillus sp. W0181 TaxID=3391581 RepID=UPI003F457C6B
MRNTLKVAKWEVKRNMKNKSFIIGLFITPIIFLLFFFVPSFFSDDAESEPVDVFVNDEIHVFEDLSSIVLENDFINWTLHEADMDEDAMIEQLRTTENTAFISLTDSALNSGSIPVYTSEEIGENFMNQVTLLEEPLRQLQLKQQGFTDTELEKIMKKVTFESITLEDTSGPQNPPSSELAGDDDPMERLIPGAFAGIILFSIVISGMMIFQSASQEKKDKLAEIILSSLTPNELMQGKIIGYFVLGIVQVFVWLGIAVPVAAWKFEIPILDYLFVPELIILLVISMLGYLLFASLFVGIGATIEDVSTSGNFQGIVLMLPFLPFLFVGPILSDPNGLIAKITSYIPITSPAVLIVRLSILDEWPWLEIAIAGSVLIISVWLFMKLAGKIFKTGILLYGKNATPREIWKWLWT